MLVRFRVQPSSRCPDPRVARRSVASPPKRVRRPTPSALPRWTRGGQPRRAVRRLLLRRAMRSPASHRPDGCIWCIWAAMRKRLFTQQGVRGRRSSHFCFHRAQNRSSCRRSVPNRCYSDTHGSARRVPVARPAVLAAIQAAGKRLEPQSGSDARTRRLSRRFPARAFACEQ